MREHDGCTGCKHYEKYRYIVNTTSEMPCYDCEMAHSQNTLKDKYEPMTNADRIRNMTDEELVVVLNNPLEIFSCENCEARPFNGTCNSMNCESNTLRWLQSEAKESEVE